VLTLAFGMADPSSLQASIDSLELRGVNTIAVVRLFMSGESFLQQTEFLFGQRIDAPATAMVGHHMMKGAQLTPLKTRSRILVDRAGMAGSPEVSNILIDRAGAFGVDLGALGLVLVAHGMGDDAENDRLLNAIEVDAQALRGLGIADVRVVALREDWGESRPEAERVIRRHVEALGEAWPVAGVIPYRLFDFGPYAEVLEGLNYEAAEGLLPHPLITQWIASRTAAVLHAAGIEPPSLVEAPRLR